LRIYERFYFCQPLEESRANLVVDAVIVVDLDVHPHAERRVLSERRHIKQGQLAGDHFLRVSHSSVTHLPS